MKSQTLCTINFGEVFVDALADALVFAVTYINCRSCEEDDSSMDEDIGVLESIADYLSRTTPAEQDALAAAAERALAAEKASKIPRKALVEDYSRWMEDMFTIGWAGNKRVDT